MTNGNLVGEDAYGGFPNAANVYGYNSSKLLAAYGTSAITASAYLSSTYFDLGYRTVNYVVTVLLLRLLVINTSALVLMHTS